MPTVRKIVVGILDAIELFLPLIAFACLFLTFVFAIIARYVFDRAFGWTTEIELVGYIWTVILAACYAKRRDRHVRFTLVYDLLGPRMKCVWRIISNLILLVPYLYLFWPTVRYVFRLRTVSFALQIPLKFYYWPMIWLVGIIIVYSAYEIVVDARKLFSGGCTLTGEAAVTDKEIA